jgi:hypothetical protein
MNADKKRYYVSLNYANCMSCEYLHIEIVVVVVINIVYKLIMFGII